MIAYLHHFSNLGWITTASQSKAVWLMSPPPTSWPGPCKKTFFFFIKENIFGSLILYSDFSFTVAFEKQKKWEVGIQITWVPPLQLNDSPIPLPPLLSCQWGWGSCVSAVSLKEEHQGQLSGSCRTLIQLAQPLFLWVENPRCKCVLRGGESLKVFGRNQLAFGTTWGSLQTLNSINDWGDSVHWISQAIF